MLVTEMAQTWVKQVLREGDLAVDATVGNGHDTLFLAKLVGETGFVAGFDLQEEALAGAKEALGAEKLEARCRLYQESHANLSTRVRHEFAAQQARVVMFNLGYLPGGDKTVTTLQETTLMALEGAVEILIPGGIVSVVLYPGHDEGLVETKAVLEWAAMLSGSFRAVHTCLVNRSERAPQLLVLERIERRFSPGSGE